MAKDFYRILGVDPNASQKDIRSAYREQVKKLHPDRFGKDSGPFLALQEAYEVLSDPNLRRAYDKGKFKKKGGGIQPKGDRTRSRRRRPPVEPLTPLDQFNHSEKIWRDPYQDFSQDTYYSSFPDRFFGRQPFSHFETRTIHVEIPITFEQAQKGGQFQVQIPLEIPCPNCKGRGHIDLIACAHCRGEGRVVLDIPLEMNLPAGIDRRYRGRVSLQRYGLPHTELVVRLNIR